VEGLKKEIMSDVRNEVRIGIDNLRGSIATDVNSTVRNDVEEWLAKNRAPDKGFNEEVLVKHILSELQRLELIWPNGTVHQKVVEAFYFYISICHLVKWLVTDSCG
jgi:hypothetical protein